MSLHGISTSSRAAEADLRDGQACEDASCQHKRNGDAEVQDEAGVLLGRLLVREGMHHAGAEGQRNGLDHGREGVEEADEHHVDAAIGARPRASGADGSGHGDIWHLSAARWMESQWPRRGRDEVKSSVVVGANAMMRKERLP
jgi:hypothetical protein